MLCGLPVRQPLAGEMLYERRNGDFVLQITGHPNYGLPFGQDRIVPIYLATLAMPGNRAKRFASELRPKCWRHSECTKAARNTGDWWPPSNGSLGRLFSSAPTASAEQRKVVQQSRFSFFTEAQIWYSRDPQQYPVSEQFENVIVLSDEFYREITAHPIPADLEAVKVLAGAPAVLDLFLWLSYRCFFAKGRRRFPLSGASGLV